MTIILSLIEKNDHISTKRAIELRGSRSDYDLLTHYLLHGLNSMRCRLPLMTCEFMNSNVGISLEIELDDDQHDDGTVVEENGSFVWHVAEESLAVIIALQFYPMGYAEFSVDHVHIDEGMDASAISLLCIVDE